MTDVKAQSEDHAPDHPHPSTFSPATFALLIVLAIFGAIIGIQLILQLGVTPNTSIIGALVAMILARLPLKLFARYRSVHVQNLAQSNISAATFGAANSLLVPIGVPFLLGRGDLILPMLVGAALAMLLDAYLLYRMFDTKVFPASGTWPPGVAAAEAIKAGDQGGRQGLLLVAGLAIGMVGSWLKIPMSAFGVAFIGNIAALSMFGVGLLVRGYTLPVTGIDITQYYVPHGFMVGAGIVALVQVIMTISQRADAAKAVGSRSDEELRGALQIGAVGYVAIAALIAAIGGLSSELSWPMLIAFVIYAAFAAFIHELLVGIAAMHSGWFPAFAVALITLIIGILIGFPPVALGLLVGFSAATGPAFADMGYDLKAGYILRAFGRCRLEALGVGHTRRAHSVFRRAKAPTWCPVLDRPAHSKSARRMGRVGRYRDARHRLAPEGRRCHRVHGGTGGRIYRRRRPLRLLRLGDQDKATDRQMTPIDWPMQ